MRFSALVDYILGLPCCRAGPFFQEPRGFSWLGLHNGLTSPNTHRYMWDLNSVYRKRHILRI